MIRVAPDAQNPTHHISLRGRGGKTIGLVMCDSKGVPTWSGFRRMAVERTSLKTTSGNNSYADLEYPYAPVVQDDWSGGRGNLDFERDSTRFYDSFRLRTSLSNKAFLGPQEQFTTGTRDQDMSTPGAVAWNKMIDSKYRLAVRFIASASYTAEQIWLLLRRRGTPNNLIVAVYSDSAGAVGTEIDSVTVSASDLADILSEWVVNTVSASLTSGTAYWVVVTANTSDDTDNHWQIGTRNETGTTKYGASWDTASFDLYYRVLDGDGDKTVIFFDYKGQQYKVVSDATGAPSLFTAGDRGAADSNTGQLDKLIDGTKSWTTDEHVGSIVFITDGLGKAEAQRWRVITGNTATKLTVDSDWTIDHTTNTEYVILSPNWTEITGHGLTAPVTGVLVTTTGIVLFAQGDTVNLRRFREYNNAGTWTRQFADDGTNKATFLAYKPQANKIFIGNNADGSGDVSVASGAPVEWATASHTFSSTTKVGERYYKMTGLAVYADLEGNEAIWVGKEDIPWIVPSSGSPYPFALNEMKTMLSDRNFKANLVHNVYLLFSLGVKLERWYGANLDDIGPDLGEGLPAGRNGAITAMLGYPGKFFAAIDAGEGYSSLMVRDGSGWHEHYRAPMGKRIRALGYQATPGTTLDRLWMYVGNDTIWLPFPSETTSELEDSNYLFTHEGALVLSRMHSGMFDVQKLTRYIKLWTENLEEDVCWIELDYRLDNETNWSSFDDVLKESPQSTIDLGIVPLYGLGAKRIQLRLRFNTTDPSRSPILLAAIIEAVIRIGVKHIRPIVFRLADNEQALSGEADEFANAMEKLAYLDDLADDTNNTMVLMRSVSPLYDGRMVFLNSIDVNQVQSKHDPSNASAANVYVCTTSVQDA